MSDSPPATDWLDNQDLRLLRDVATAVLRLAEVSGLDSFTLPYPAQSQRALDALVLSCLRAGARPPSGLPELLRWCRTRPLFSWPLDGLHEAGFQSTDRLIDGSSGEPTQLCHELAVEGRGDSASRQYDRLVVHEAMRACREASSPESYTAFRRLLVTRPVLTEADWLDIAADLYLDPVRDLLDVIYVEVPDSYRRDGGYTPCGRCLTLLTPMADKGWWCERDQCRHLGTPPPAPTLNPAECGEVRHLFRPLRQFVTWPGQAEVSLEARLRTRGLAVEMWPGFDAYDLRVTFPDGHVWAIDVKDWAHPGLLGRAAEAVRRDPPYDEACWVVPRFRVEVRRDYLEVYARERTERAAGLRLLTDDQLVAAATARLRGSRGPSARIAPLSTEHGDLDA
ncbi:hypothetical protein AQ490_22110 [Wenjunlia vitaminophila]|uniref:REase associating with pPIWI RE domain-containing protein n=1 Tax=Wenjunlia vitaminophila TaxID=76728 RepID=A0A0T6LSB3_WENVI|nr:HU-CCDC81 and SPOR domain-containing protein [Wenjunlia vitaminophila]KRV49011.1 hypothetical protein AQ490_22110 [Wenjunlia vitaminophila]